jgi:hypothetical protein
MKAGSEPMRKPGDDRRSAHRSRDGDWAAGAWPICSPTG